MRCGDQWFVGAVQCTRTNSDTSASKLHIVRLLEDREVGLVVVVVEEIYPRREGK